MQEFEITDANTPNAATRAAMEEARAISGDVARSEHLGTLLRDLRSEYYAFVRPAHRNRDLLERIEQALGN